MAKAKKWGITGDLPEPMRFNRHSIGTVAILHFLALTCTRASIYSTGSKRTVVLHRSPVRGEKANDRAGRRRTISHKSRITGDMGL